MRKFAFALSLCTAVLTYTSQPAYADGGSSSGDDNSISILDRCDPKDPGWAPTGGCLLKEGDVSVAEFTALLTSPLGPAGTLFGHPAWRNSPSHIVAEKHGTTASINVRNAGGRGHTFTEVANFGGGFVPALNGAITAAPECVQTPAPQVLAPGQRAQVTGLAPGLHKFQCCIHPWMRATVRVK